MDGSHMMDTVSKECSTATCCSSSCGCLHVTTALLQNQVCVGCVRVPDPYDRGACICR